MRSALAVAILGVAAFASPAAAAGTSDPMCGSLASLRSAAGGIATGGSATAAARRSDFTTATRALDGIASSSPAAERQLASADAVALGKIRGAMASIGYNPARVGKLSRGEAKQLAVGEAQWALDTGRLLVHWVGSCALHL